MKHQRSHVPELARQDGDAIAGIVTALKSGLQRFEALTDGRALHVQFLVVDWDMSQLITTPTVVLVPRQPEPERLADLTDVWPSVIQDKLLPMAAQGIASAVLGVDIYKPIVYADTPDLLIQANALKQETIGVTFDIPFILS